MLKLYIMKDQTKLIAALLIGAAAGAAVGLLLAPNRGEDLRGDIADYVNDLVDSAKGKTQSAVNDLKNYGTNMVGKVKSKIYDGVDDANDYGHEHITEVKSKVKATANDANNAVQAI